MILPSARLLLRQKRLPHKFIFGARSRRLKACRDTVTLPLSTFSGNNGSSQENDALGGTTASQPIDCPALDSALSSAAEATTTATTIFPSTTDPIAVTLATSSSDHALAHEFSWYNINAYTMDLVHFTHDITGLSYASSIFLITVAFRAAILPLGIWALKVDPTIDDELREVKEKYKRATNRRTRNMLATQGQYLTKRARTDVWRRLSLPLTSLGGFLVIWSGLRNMVYYYPEDMCTGGVLWFVDLTQPDEVVFLPLLSTTLFFVMGEVGADSLGRPIKEYSWKWRWFWRSFRVLCFPILLNANSALFCYWVPNAVCSVVQTIVLSQPPVLKALGVERKGDKKVLLDGAVQFAGESDKTVETSSSKISNETSSSIDRKDEKPTRILKVSTPKRKKGKRR